MTKKDQPPEILQKLLGKLIDQEISFSIMEALEDQYKRNCNQKGPVFSLLVYLFHYFTFLLSHLFFTWQWRMPMLKNYFKIALRNLVKHKVFSLINVTGLAVGMACTILICLWIVNQLNYDGFHKNGPEIYRVMIKPQDKDTYYTFTPGALGAALVEEFPEIEDFSRLHPLYPFDKNPLVNGDNKFYLSGAVVDPSFFSMFTFPFIKGDKKAPFAGPYSIVITTATAKKFFGHDNALGKTLKFEYWRRQIGLKISGIIKDFPANSHIQHDFFLPTSAMRQMGRNIDSWQDIFSPTYILVKKGIHLQSLKDKVKDTIIRHQTKRKSIVHLQSLSRIHLHKFGGGGQIVYIYIFATIGLLVLMIAVFNFMNLSTARSINRAKEVGIRKTIGAGRYQLIKQFLGESIFLSAIAMVIAIVLVMVLMPALNLLFDTSLQFAISGYTLLLLSLFVLLLGTAAGAYPALLLSRFKPISILRGPSSSHSRKFYIRKFLVITQFSISILLIISATVIYKQLNFIKTRDLGFEKQNIINLEMGGNFFQRFSIIKSELLKNPRIEAITAANSSFVTREKGTYTASWEGKDPNNKVYMEIHPVDFDYAKTLNMHITAGRFFSEEFPADQKESVVLNEAAIKAMGIESPLGKKFFFHVANEKRDAKIIGVVKDFNYLSLHKKVEPLIFVIAPWWYNEVYIRINSQNIAETLGFIKSKLIQLVPEYVFGYTFLSEDINRLYTTEERAKNLVTFGSILTIFIACLGLFGLASFTVQQRTKEIGIRKVLGASLSRITTLLSKELLSWILLANILAWPVSFFLVRKWLQNFAYQVETGVEVYIFSALAALVVGFFTITVQTLKAALTNPVNVLRCE
jgi:putative ABC transport system permease protein